MSRFPLSPPDRTHTSSRGQPKPWRTRRQLRIQLDYPSAFLVDYMTVLKENGRWVIIAKSFNSAPKSR